MDCIDWDEYAIGFHFPDRGSIRQRNSFSILPECPVMISQVMHEKSSCFQEKHGSDGGLLVTKTKLEELKQLYTVHDITLG